jgi:hypothetical protein
MNQAHLTRDEMTAFTHGLLDKTKADAVAAHLSSCSACHEQQSQMAMAAIMAKMQETAKHNEQWTCTDPFWARPYPNAPVGAPHSSREIGRWENEHHLHLPAALSRTLTTQDGGCVRDTEIVICPLAEFKLLSAPKWDDVFRFNQIASQRDKLLYIGFESQVPASIILNYADDPEPAVLYLWHDLGDELRLEADSFDSLLASRKSAVDSDAPPDRAGT